MIRVLRVLEYTYETPERMCEDMARWTTNHKSRSLTMTSSIVSISADGKPYEETESDLFT